MATPPDTPLAGVAVPPDADAAAAALKRVEDARAAKEASERATRNAALIRAQEAEREATLAQQERDAADERLRAAHARAARERAAAEPVQDDAAAGDDLPNAGDPPLLEALLHHEAAALLNLHAQAVAVQNIRALVPLVLDLNSAFFARWRESFLLTVGKFSLQQHLLSDDTAHNSPDWARMDCVVRTWLLGTISDDLADAISERGATARTTWLAIESQFLGNRATRALFADQEFRSFSQGDLTVSEYCWRYKRMAEDLRDLGEPIPDRTLVLNIIRGLNERFTALGLHLRRSNPLPTFLQVRDDLHLEELTMAKTAPAVALAATANHGGTALSTVPAAPAAPPPQKPQQQAAVGYGGSAPKRGKRGGKRGGGSGSQPGGGPNSGGASATSPAAPRPGPGTTPGPGPSRCGLDRGLRRRMDNHRMLCWPGLKGNGPASGVFLPPAVGISKPSPPTSRRCHSRSRHRMSGILIPAPHII